MEEDPVLSKEDPDTRLPLTVERVILAASMGAMALIGLANVLTRYLSDISLAFTEEFSVVLMVVVTLSGAAYAFASGRHVRIDYLIGLAPSRVRRRAEVVSCVIGLAMFAVIVGYGISMCWDSYRFGVKSPGMGHPEWIYLSTIPVLGSLVLVRLAGRLVRTLKGDWSN